MLVGQFFGRKGLRDITDIFKAQDKRFYHLGMKRTHLANPCQSQCLATSQPASL